MSSQRLFIGLSLSPPLRERLLGLQTPIPEMRWVTDNQLHLTIKYLGNTESDLKEKVCTQLHLISQSHEVFRAEVQDVGVFPNPTYTKILWAGLNSSSPLIALQSAIEQKMSVIGFEPEQRAYLPHITLGRCKKPRQAVKLISFWLNQHAGEFIGIEEFTKIHLYESETHPEGALYTHLNTFELNK